jgi:DivIVA domain-containing protein
MSNGDGVGAQPQASQEQRSGGLRFAELGDRVVRAFGSPERATPSWAGVEANNGHGEDEPRAPDKRTAPFRSAWRGYDRGDVDDYVAELEGELAELRARSGSEPSVAEEIQRIGEEATAILRVAHEQADAATGRARAQAESCIAEAQANAEAITEAAQEHLRQLDKDTDAVWCERARLIDDTRGLADRLLSIADDAAERFPPEPEEADQPTQASPGSPAQAAAKDDGGDQAGGPDRREGSDEAPSGPAGE